MEMNKIFMALCCAAVLAACTKEVPVANWSTPDTITAESAKTKVSMTDSESSFTYNWKSGDQIWFVSTEKSGTNYHRVRYQLSEGAGSESGKFALVSGDAFQSGLTYTICHVGKQVKFGTNSEFYTKPGTSEDDIFAKQISKDMEDRIMFIGKYENGGSDAYTCTAENVPSSVSFESPFSYFKVSVTNNRSEAVTPSRIVVTGNDDCFVSTLQITETGIAPSVSTNTMTLDLTGCEQIAAGASASYIMQVRKAEGASLTSLKMDFYGSASTSTVLYPAAEMAFRTNSSWNGTTAANPTGWNSGFPKSETDATNHAIECAYCASMWAQQKYDLSDVDFSKVTAMSLNLVNQNSSTYRIGAWIYPNSDWTESSEQAWTDGSCPVVENFKTVVGAYPSNQTSSNSYLARCESASDALKVNQLINFSSSNITSIQNALDGGCINFILTFNETNAGKGDRKPKYYSNSASDEKRPTLTITASSESNLGSLEKNLSNPSLSLGQGYRVGTITIAAE